MCSSHQPSPTPTQPHTSTPVLGRLPPTCFTSAAPPGGSHNRGATTRAGSSAVSSSRRRTSERLRCDRRVIESGSSRASLVHLACIARAALMHNTCTIRAQSVHDPCIGRASETYPRVRRCKKSPRRRNAHLGGDRQAQVVLWPRLQVWWQQLADQQDEDEGEAGAVCV